MLTIRALLFGTLILGPVGSLGAQVKLNDLEMAHVAVTADAIDIDYAKLVLRHSKNSTVREFAETMIRDHIAVTAQVVALSTADEGQTWTEEWRLESGPIARS